jgi:hypothetical protein
VTRIGSFAFDGGHGDGWERYNMPFVIPKSVEVIEAFAFSDWHAFNQPFVIPPTVRAIERWAFRNWKAYDQPNCRRAHSTYDWLRIGEWVFAGCWCGSLAELRARLDSGESTPIREAAYAEISKPIKEIK